jgi:hypothetical protein
VLPCMNQRKAAGTRIKPHLIRHIVASVDGRTLAIGVRLTESGSVLPTVLAGANLGTQWYLSRPERHPRACPAGPWIAGTTPGTPALAGGRPGRR